MKRHIANILTVFRILFSLYLLQLSVFSNEFIAVYLICGITDMADGFIARKTNTVSDFGSRLDSVADLIFLTAAFIKFLPQISLPGWLWGWIIMIGLVKTGNLILGFVCRKQFLFAHTPANKITGLLLFLFPLTIPRMGSVLGACLVCIAASFAAVAEIISPGAE